MTKRETAINMLNQGVCEIEFTKVDGSKRIMHATLKEDLVPKSTNVNPDAPKQKVNEEVVPCYDVNAPGWRSFRLDLLNTIKTIKL